MLLFIWFYTASNNRQEQISIHLMLLFITNKRIFFQINSHISIHLMLLFICPAWSCPYPHLNFNTSHVTVYPHRPCLFYTVSFISIHLMLLFIIFWRVNISILILFQYISCYCLSIRAVHNILITEISIHLMLLFIINTDSFVTVYRKFQYISCYCLSLEDYVLEIKKHNFNTSHVTVYLTS